MERAPNTGVAIIVVGGGIAGLAFAIEGHRKGHNVQIFERRPRGDSDGEGIIILPHALITPKKWPGFLERAFSFCLCAKGTIKAHDGTVVTEFIAGTDTSPSLPIYRATLHKVLFEYAESLGIPIECDAKAKDFFETKEHGGIILTDGRRLTADVVVAADGVGTKSWETVIGTKDKPISSGFVLYRNSYPATPALKNPIVAAEVGDAKEKSWLIHGPDAHIVIGLGQDKFFWVLTCREQTEESTEDWSRYISIDKAVAVVKDWYPFVPELIKQAPNGVMLDWKLMWRNPQPRWVAPRGRVVQIGDAAHPFLPTSANGANMAMEDGYTLAACLQIGGKGNVPLATKVFNKLRFERVACAQKQGFKNREHLHKADLEFLKQHPEVLTSVYNNWMTTHNAEQYAYDNYVACASHIKNGTPFENSNGVPGYKYKPWTVEELMEASDRGEPVHDEGLWN
ncbi:FAD/NAD(P)-binding domain-containing protein [Corynespora cassiicola Philippines]|uniref:FAD/NAD(P)-binding domain-containing protein n=1 Tax=Corynespora cassiicola Philippines TaxID=1448308 RepID=A0A2T2NFI7_CORCC|nr:FAD/NAD(P)-binding domain-containing protein [Corynespora cassiicola Philippines]